MRRRSQVVRFARADLRTDQMFVARRSFSRNNQLRQFRFLRFRMRIPLRNWLRADRLRLAHLRRQPSKFRQNRGVGKIGESEKSGIKKVRESAKSGNMKIVESENRQIGKKSENRKNRGIGKIGESEKSGIAGSVGVNWKIFCRSAKLNFFSEIATLVLSDFN
jgi:hypothetical protein